MKKAGTNRKKFKAKFKAFSNKAEGTHELHCQSPTPPFFSFNFFGNVTKPVYAATYLPEMRIPGICDFPENLNFGENLNFQELSLTVHIKGHLFQQHVLFMTVITTLPQVQ